MAELKPPNLVVMNRNAAINPQDQTEVPRPLPCILYILFLNNGVLPFSPEGQRSPPPAPLPPAIEAIFYWKTLLFFTKL